MYITEKDAKIIVETMKSKMGKDGLWNVLKYLTLDDPLRIEISCSLFENI